MEERGVSSILVVKDGKLAGVVTRRDAALIENPNQLVSNVLSLNPRNDGKLVLNRILYRS